MDNQVKFWCPRRLVYVTCEWILLKFENDAKFHVFTADSIKRTSFSDMATCCLSVENRRLRGVYCFQDRSNDLGKAHLWNVCLLLRDCTAPYTRRLWSSSIKSFKSYCKGGDPKICKINEPISVSKTNVLMNTYLKLTRTIWTPLFQEHTAILCQRMRCIYVKQYSENADIMLMCLSSFPTHFPPVGRVAAE
jgi:hypothetical protein